MLRLRHAARLAGGLVGYSVTNRVVWLVPVAFVLALTALAIVAGQAAAPYTLYSLF